MKVLLLGSGGRESAIGWALSRSPSVTDLIAAPGNPGIGLHAQLAEVDPMSPASVADLAERTDRDLVVVGPEAPLVAGVADALRASKRAVFGPSAAAARIEGSKVYAKRLMAAAGVPSAAGRSFDSAAPAVAFMDELGPPYVVKADGLAAGKGVVVTPDRDEAVLAIEDRLVRRIFGDAGATVVIEEFLDGPEVSLIAFVDGRNVVACEPAQDYKRVLDDDQGPNTGGMGAYSPVPVCPPDLAARIVDDIMLPMVRGTADAGAPFIGALYAGLALTGAGPRVIEFNVRFGDPETQAVLPRLQSDFAEVCLAAATGGLAGVELEWTPRACVSVVLASGGYPGAFDAGFEIEGLDEAAALDDVYVFHAGAARRGDAMVTAGGRVLAVSALGKDLSAARRRAYEAADVIDFKNKHLRRDIARSAGESGTG